MQAQNIANIHQTKYVCNLQEMVREVSKKKYSLLVGPWDFQLTFFVLFNTILGPFFTPFYRTQVNLGSDSWVRMSVSESRTLVRLN